MAHTPRTRAHGAHADPPDHTSDVAPSVPPESAERATIDEVGAVLLRAAGEVLASEGPAALTVRRIAAVAGVSTMNVYSRFGGKDGVVDHLYIEGFARLRAAMEATPATPDPMFDLRCAGEAYRRFAHEHPTYYTVMFDAVVEFQPSVTAIEHASGTLGLLADRLQRAMDAGVLALADPVVTAASVWAACHGVVSLERRAVGPPGLDWEAVYRSTTMALMSGLTIGPLHVTSSVSALSAVSATSTGSTTER
jgi:AcrR family transcriptional regulator